MRDVLETLERWAADGMPVAIATVVGTERSAPRDPGAVLAVSAEGEVAGSVTGGCVEPAVYGEARDVLAGGEPRLKTYGIADDEAFEVGLPCGGTVHIFVDRLDPELVAPIAEAVREERPILASADAWSIAPKTYIFGLGAKDDTKICSSSPSETNPVSPRARSSRAFSATSPFVASSPKTSCFLPM